MVSSNAPTSTTCFSLINGSPPHRRQLLLGCHYIQIESRTNFQFSVVCCLDMLAGIFYTEISDQTESEPGCPRLKSTYEITAYFPYAEHIISGKLCLGAVLGLAVGSKSIVSPQWK